MSTPVSAHLVRDPGGVFERVDGLRVDEPRADEVLVRYTSCGLCHTDLMRRDSPFPSNLPSIFGHEGVGVVEQAGIAVKDVTVGDRVIVSFSFCGSCAMCRSGLPPHCERFRQLNFDPTRADGTYKLTHDGQPLSSNFFGQSAFASHNVVSERSLVKIPADAPAGFERIAGPLACGVQTGAGAVFNVLRPPIGGSVAVFGAGTVGLSAVLAAQAIGMSEIAVVDIVDSRLELAKQLGATVTINGLRGNAAEEILDATSGGVMCALDTTGNAGVIRQSLTCVRPRGTVGLVGAGSGEVSFDYPSLLGGGRRVLGIIEGDAVPQVFIPFLIQLHAQGRFPFDRLVSHYEMGEVNVAARDSLEGRAVKPVLHHPLAT